MTLFREVEEKGGEVTTKELSQAMDSLHAI
jgi:hypothetical protein